MKINGKICNSETMNSRVQADAVMHAASYEANLMRIALNDDSIKKQDAILTSQDKSEEEKVVARQKKEKLTAQNLEYKLENTEYEPEYQEVLSSITSAKTEYASNDLESVRNILRLIACTENKKFFKGAIIASGAKFEKLYELFNSVHDCTTVDENGRTLYCYPHGKLWNVHSEAKDELEKLLKQLFQLPVENKYTGKVSFKFNRTDLAMLHETYVRDLDLKYSKDKNGEFTCSDISMRTAIVKKIDKEGNVKFDGGKFLELLAKLAFQKIYG